jgi:hypothetical protein
MTATAETPSSNDERRGNAMENPSSKCPPTNDPDPSAWAIFLPNPEDCGSYYVCNWGEAILMPCPAGLHFNAQLHVCDWPADAGCTPVTKG